VIPTTEKRAVAAPIKGFRGRPADIHTYSGLNSTSLFSRIQHATITARCYRTSASSLKTDVPCARQARQRKKNLRAKRNGDLKSVVGPVLTLKVRVFRGQKYQAAYPIPKVSSAFCYEKHPFEAGTKSIETRIETGINADRRGLPDTESIEPDIDTKSRAAAYFWK
jgi:hypothetical protein